ncbi:IS630 family transposase, partial [Escherichia coli]
PVFHTIVSIKNDGHYFCRAGGNRPDGLNEPVTYNQKIHVILDGAGYHRSQLVKDWAEVVNIRLHYLPPYSPNLNPIERMWKLMNEHARNNRYFSSTREFREAISVFFNQTLPDIADSLTSRINDHFQVLTPAS